MLDNHDLRPTWNLYDNVLVSIGVLGGVTAGAAYTIAGASFLLAGSVGLNVALVVWAYTLHEGWHRDNEEAIA